MCSLIGWLFRLEIACFLHPHFRRGVRVQTSWEHKISRTLILTYFLLVIQFEEEDTNSMQQQNINISLPYEFRQRHQICQVQQSILTMQQF